MKRAAALLLALCLLLSFSACGGDGFQNAAITPTTDLSRDAYYFYGVIRHKGLYYACLLPEYQAEANQDDMLYVPLADDLVARFQPTDLIGAWSPEPYYTAKALYEAAKNGRITMGACFSYTITDGRMDHLEECSDYEDFDVTTGMPL